MNNTIKFYDFHIWATNKLFNHLSSLSNELVFKEVPSSFPTIMDTLIHLYVVEKGGLATLKQEEPIDINEMAENVKGLTILAQSKDMDGLKNLFDELHAEYKNFLKSIKDFEQVIPIFFGHAHTSYADFITHLVNHGTNHRGNITTMLRQLGHEGCNTDYGSFIYEQQKR